MYINHCYNIYVIQTIYSKHCLNISIYLMQIPLQWQTSASSLCRGRNDMKMTHQFSIQLVFIYDSRNVYLKLLIKDKLTFDFDTQSKCQFLPGEYTVLSHFVVHATVFTHTCLSHLQFRPVLLISSWDCSFMLPADSQLCIWIQSPCPIIRNVSATTNWLALSVESGMTGGGGGCFGLKCIFLPYSLSARQISEGWAACWWHMDERNKLFTQWDPALIVYLHLFAQLCSVRLPWLHPTHSLQTQGLKTHQANALPGFIYHKQGCVLFRQCSGSGAGHPAQELLLLNLICFCETPS